MILSTILVVLGFILLINGADMLVDGSSNLAKRLHIPEIIIGLTIVSIGTSTPELFVSITSIINGYEDISLGNVIGSNICNLLLILGLSALVTPLKFKKQTKKIEIPINFIATLLLFYFCNKNQYISRLDGGVLLLFFILFIIYTIILSIRATNKVKCHNNECNQKIKIIPNLILILFSVFVLKIGADLVVNNSIKIAHIFKISEKVIGLTIVSVGTSLPELVTSITAAFKKNTDIAIGNIIGSNIFNILAILGLTSIIRPIPYSPSYNIQLYILILANILIILFPYLGKKNEMTKTNGLIYIILYVVYLIILI